jgi:hypothetical protein
MEIFCEWSIRRHGVFYFLFWRVNVFLIQTTNCRLSVVFRNISKILTIYFIVLFLENDFT